MFGMTSEEFLLLADYTKNGLHIINGALLYTYAVPLNGGASPSVLTAVYFNETILTELFQSSDALLFLEDGEGRLYSPASQDAPELTDWFYRQQAAWAADGRRTENRKSALRLAWLGRWHSLSLLVFQTKLSAGCRAAFSGGQKLPPGDSSGTRRLFDYPQLLPGIAFRLSG